MYSSAPSPAVQHVGISGCKNKARWRGCTIARLVLSRGMHTIHRQACLLRYPRVQEKGYVQGEGSLAGMIVHIHDWPSRTSILMYPDYQSRARRGWSASSPLVAIIATFVQSLSASISHWGPGSVFSIVHCWPPASQ
jgi:hypothetical protein